ncbi:MAG: glutamine amidotransferase [Rhodobacteraceae bacterium]|nr:glutamine amidotransferase [Paracoccaceae bacterium]
MCGIVGLFLKDPALHDSLGEMFAPMLIEMSDRGPDSAGVAVYRNATNGSRKFTVSTGLDEGDWNEVCNQLHRLTGKKVASVQNCSHRVLTTDAEPAEVEKALADLDPLAQLMSVGRMMEIYKEVGLPAEVVERFGISGMKGSHAIGHTRMATESAVITAGSHPFSTGLDMCLVHNGSLSNHNRLREVLRRRAGIEFKTENDTEVAAAYISDRIDSGHSLHNALEACIDDLDGFYTFVAGTSDGFAALRDPIACKPAVLAETASYVAFGSEYRALARLPDIAAARVWEPDPAKVYSWTMQ